MSAAAAVWVELENTQCWCGLAFAVPAALYKEARSRSSLSIYCPVGHTFCWRESDADRLKKQLAVKEQELAFVRGQRDAAEKRASAAKGQVTKLTKRIGNGVCPNCNRHFTNVERHMRSKHPDEATA